MWNNLWDCNPVSFYFRLWIRLPFLCSFIHCLFRSFLNWICLVFLIFKIFFCSMVLKWWVMRLNSEWWVTLFLYSYCSSRCISLWVNFWKDHKVLNRDPTLNSSEVFSHSSCMYSISTLTVLYLKYWKSMWLWKTLIVERMVLR